MQLVPHDDDGLLYIEDGIFEHKELLPHGI